MDVQPKQPSAKGLAEWFTGDVWIDAIARGAEPSRIRVTAVHFTPGARRGTPTPSARRCTSPRARGSCSPGAATSSTSVPGTSSPRPPTSGTGTGPRPTMTRISMTEGVAEGQGPETEWGAHVTDAEYRQQREARASADRHRRLT